jgi:hypothetical protein
MLNIITLFFLTQAPPHEPSVRLALGAQVGFPHVVGVVGRTTLFVKGRPRFDVDLLWEPSAFLQSYSAGGAYHVLDSIFVVGPRVRLIQFQAPWARGYDARTDNHLGLGLEGGIRVPVGLSQHGNITVGIQGTWVPTQAPNLQFMFGLFAGFTWSVWEQ